MAEDALKVGVIGVGALGRHHARVWASVPGARLVGVFDTEPARAAEVAAQQGCRAYGDVDVLARRRAGRLGRRPDRRPPRGGPPRPRAGPGRPAREADDRDPRGGRRPPGARRGARGGAAGGPHRALQPRDRGPALGGEGSPVRGSPPAGLLLAAQPRRGRGPRPHDPRPRHRPVPRRLRTRPDRGGGGAGAHVPRGHRQRPAAVRLRADREPDRQPGVGREGEEVPGLRPPDLRFRRLHGAGSRRSTAWSRTSPDGPGSPRPGTGRPTRSRCACRSRPLPRRSATAHVRSCRGATAAEPWPWPTRSSSGWRRHLRVPHLRVPPGPERDPKDLVRFRCPFRPRGKSVSPRPAPSTAPQAQCPTRLPPPSTGRGPNASKCNILCGLLDPLPAGVLV